MCPDIRVITVVECLVCHGVPSVSCGARDRLTPLVVRSSSCQWNASEAHEPPEETQPQTMRRLEAHDDADCTGCSVDWQCRRRCPWGWGRWHATRTAPRLYPK